MQIRRFNWLDDDLTASLNKANQTAIPSGLYKGFAWDGAVSLVANFAHTTNGTTVVNSDDPITTISNVGEWRTKQGGIVQETSAIGVTFDAPSTLNRIDLVVGQHKYIESVGGASATYLVIKGTEGASPVAPVLTIPEQQVILGQMYIPGGGVELEDSTYTISPVPNFNNDDTIAHLDRTQTFLEENVISQMTAEYGVCYLDVAGSKIDLSKDSLGVSLVGDVLRRNLKKNKFLLGIITALPTTITSIEPYPHEFTLEAKEIEFITFSPLILSGSLFFEHHFNDVEIPTISSFKLLTIQDTLGTGSFPNTWKLINGGEATINGSNAFTAINSWDKVTGSINGDEVVLHSDGGNFVEVPTTPSTNIVKGIEAFRAGTYMVLKGDGEPLHLVHNTSDPITKKLWLPHGKAFTSFSDNEIFLFVEDVDYWRLVGTYNQVDNWHYVGDATTGMGTTFSGYANSGFNGNLSFRMMDSNNIQFSGQVNKIDLTTASNNQLFTLPIGYRPLNSVQKLVTGTYYSVPAGTSSFSSPCILTILSSGVVSLSPFDAFEQFGSITACVSGVFVNTTFNLD